MKRWRIATAALIAGLLAACGGGGDGNQSPRASYSRLVVFGDSLSDVGTYRTAGVASIGGGKFTVNGGDDRIWVERLAAQLGVAAPCPAQTGLEASGPFAGLAAPIVNVAGCYGYAQGGSRVTNPVGPYNKALLGLGSNDGYLGQITDPLINQFQRHLAAGGYSGNELVVLLAGGNDIFMNLATLQATVGAGGDPVAAATAAVTAMGVAGAELAAYVGNFVVGQGARRVVVVNLPDVSLTPFAASLGAQTQGLILTMSQTFNAQLAAGLANVPNVLQVDAFTQSQSQAASPSQYGVSNGAATACDLALATLGSLGCSVATLLANTDVSRYQYADTVHPTPYGHQLLAQYVAVQMIQAGWL